MIKSKIEKVIGIILFCSIFAISSFSTILISEKNKSNDEKTMANDTNCEKSQPGCGMCALPENDDQSKFV